MEADPELITWRQGRCLAYGDGVTLWALGEIVKAQAGILEQDAPEEVAEKIHRTVEETLPGPEDVAWVESNLLALVGLAPESELGGDRRGQAFSAWRMFFEAMADRGPVVLVFEDLHWADDSLLDFVDELVEWVTDVPLLVVATARPELLERRPAWGGGKLNATTLAIQPLSDEETARLIGQLLERPLVAAESQQTLLERAGGNPLYAEQFSELYRERGSADDLPLPETLQGLIAARLDGLPPEEKGLLRDAAVVGKVFWVGALGRGDEATTAALHSLERKGFVRRQRRSSLEGEGELAFAHALVRDVAYGQIARGDRVEKHRRIAEWIEGLGRPEDHAEMLAHHWGSALELTKAMGGDVTELAPRTQVVLRDAGDRAFALNAFAAAERYYADALELAQADDRTKAELLFRRGRALYQSGDERLGPALEKARDALLTLGDRETAGEAAAFLARASWQSGRRDLVDAHLAQAEQLVSEATQSVAKALVFAMSARMRMLAGDYEDAMRMGLQALEIAEGLGLLELQAHALNSISAVAFSVERGGRAEMQRALELAREANSPETSSILNNLGYQAWERGEIALANDFVEQAQEAARRFGAHVGVRFTRAGLAGSAVMRGDWNDAREVLDELIADFERSPGYNESSMRQARAELRLARGDVEGALYDSARALARARDIGDPQALVPALVTTTRIAALAGRDDDARAHAREALDLAPKNASWSETTRLALVAERLGLRAETRDVLERAPESPWRQAALARLEGDFARTATIYDEMGVALLAAQSHLAAGESLIGQGRRSEGEAALEEALEFFRPLGATFYVERCEALLAPVQSESA